MKTSAVESSAQARPATCGIAVRNGSVVEAAERSRMRARLAEGPCCAPACPCLKLFVLRLGLLLRLKLLVARLKFFVVRLKWLRLTMVVLWEM